MEPSEQECESDSKVQSHMIKLAEDEDEEEEEDGDLFEINLEIVNKIPPPQYYWESYFTAATSSTLLANCLLPIADVSCAVPIYGDEGLRSDALLPWPGTRDQDQPACFQDALMVQYYKEMKV